MLPQDDIAKRSDAEMARISVIVFFGWTLLLAFGFGLGGWLYGHAAGVRATRQEAVSAGVADWVVEDGKVVGVCWGTIGERKR